MQLSNFVKEKDGSNWYFELDELEFYIPGNTEQPSLDYFNKVKELHEGLVFVKDKAVSLLEGFMKDKGQWFFNSLVFGDEAESKGCDFILEMGFEADINPHQYNYTGFVVFFNWPQHNQPPMNKPHPIRFSVEFS